MDPLDAVCRPSDDVVAREIGGELILVPLTAEVVDLEDELYTLNETGRVIWDRLDGTRPLRQVAEEIAAVYEAPAGQVERDVAGFAAELCRRRLLVRVDAKAD